MSYIDSMIVFFQGIGYWFNPNRIGLDYQIYCLGMNIPLLELYDPIYQYYYAPLTPLLMTPIMSFGIGVYYFVLTIFLGLAIYELVRNFRYGAIIPSLILCSLYIK